MKLRMRSVVSGAAVLALAGGMLAAGGGSAFAAAPPYEPDPTSIGSLTFFDASGAVITGGNINDAPFATYVQASANGRVLDTKATLFGYLPKNGVAIGAWSGEQLSTSSSYGPVAGAPVSVSATKPVVKLTSGDLTIATLAGDFPNTASDAYQGLYQLRLKTSGTGSPAGASYDSADILITGSTWSVVYSQAPPATPTTVSVAAAPASPQVQGTSVALTATVGPAAAAAAGGTVQFKSGASALGAPVTVSGTTAVLNTTALPVGTDSVTAVFTPTDTTTWAPSTSTAISYVITGAPAQATTTALSVNVGLNAGFSPVVLTATVTPATSGTPTGTVTFTDGATVIGTTASGSSPFTLTTSLLAPGAHTITATFNPSNNYLTSTVTGTPFTLGPAVGATPDVQTITATVAAGTLVISTPYTAASPLDLGTLALNGTATLYTATAPFTNISVTDTRAGNLPWTVQAQASALNSGANSINGQNVGLTSLVAVPIAGNALPGAPGNITTTDNNAANGVAPADPGTLGLGNAAHTVLHATNGAGSISYNGTLTINAPTSTLPGTYTGTITFTIS